MADKGNRSQFQPFVDAFNERDVAVLNELLGPRHLSSDPGTSSARDRDALKQWYAELQAICPGPTCAFADESDLWDRLADQWAVACLTRPAVTALAARTGKIVPDSGTVVIRIADGKAVDAWFVEDNEGVPEQTGIARATGQDLPR